MFRQLPTLLLAGLLVATLGGCAHYYWTKPDTTAAQFDRDSRECVQEARGKLTAGPAPGTGVDAIESMYRYCLSTRGYARVKQIEPAPPGSYRGLEDEGEFVRALGRS
jgi:hypothetical protein